jgi:hypothetical protein
MEKGTVFTSSLAIIAAAILGVHLITTMASCANQERADCVKVQLELTKTNPTGAAMLRCGGMFTHQH